MSKNKLKSKKSKKKHKKKSKVIKRKLKSSFEETGGWESTPLIGPVG